MCCFTDISVGAQLGGRRVLGPLSLFIFLLHLGWKLVGEVEDLEDLSRITLFRKGRRRYAELASKSFWSCCFTIQAPENQQRGYVQDKFQITANNEVCYQVCDFTAVVPVSSSVIETQRRLSDDMDSPLPCAVLLRIAH